MLESESLPPITEHQERILDLVVRTWTEPVKPLDPTAATLPNIARALDLSLAQLLTELTALAPHLAAVRHLSQLESTIHAAGARRIAVDVLTQIAADPDTDRLERRRAASAILRATGAPRRERPSAPRQSPEPDLSDFIARALQSLEPAPESPHTPPTVVDVPEPAIDESNAHDLVEQDEHRVDPQVTPRTAASPPRPGSTPPHAEPPNAHTDSAPTHRRDHRTPRTTPTEPPTLIKPGFR
jgi:hypothetical protein